MKNGIKNTVTILNSGLAHKGKFAAADQAIISIANFSASILLTTMVLPTELGAYMLGFLAIYFVRAIQDGLIVQPLTAYGAGKTMQEFKPYFTAASIHQAALSIVVSVAAALLGWILTQFGNDTLGPTIFVLWFSFFTWQWQEFFRRAFYTRGEVHKAMWVSFGATVIRLAFIVVLSKFAQVTGLTGINAIGWGSLLGACLGLLLAKDYFSIDYQDIFEVWLNNWKFGRWILGASLVDWIVVDLYPILVAGMISFAATGAYQTLQNLVAPIHVLLRAMDNFVTPILAKAYDQSGVGKVNKTLKMIFILGGIPVIGLLVIVIAFTPQFLFLLKGDTYLPYAGGIYPMAVFYLFLFVNRPFQMVLRAVRQGKQVFWANVFAAISIFTAGIWLINVWGLYGAIGGQALNAIIISVFSYFAWKKFVSKAIKREKSFG